MSSQPKYNYLKQMTNVAIDRKHRQKNYANHRAIYPTNSQQRALSRLFREEMAFYNNFIECMQARLRNDPDFYDKLGNRTRELFVVMAQLGFDIRTIFNRKSKNVELPPLLEPYRDLLFGINSHGESGMSEKMAIFFEVCKHGALVLSDTRKNMAYEFLNFYTAQSRSNDNSYILEVVDSMKKRHIQMAKSQVTTKVVHKDSGYGDIDTYTEIKIPQIKSPIIMRSDMEDIQSWNIMIIHKDPSQLDLGSTVLDWEVDFRQTDDKYLLKYLETPNPVSKMESRFIKR